MDPLTALSLAANVAQFLEFGSSIFHNTKEIVKAGRTVSTAHLTSLANDIKRINASLTKQYSEFDSTALTQEEKVRSTCLPLFESDVYLIRL